MLTVQNEKIKSFDYRVLLRSFYKKNLHFLVNELEFGLIDLPIGSNKGQFR